MKFKFSHIASLGLALTIASACNNVSEDERFILVETSDIKPADTTKFAQRTLIEEYTGQMCVNCPGGHSALATITAANAGKTVVVGIHAGSLAVEEPYGFMTPEGNTYAERYGVTAYPSIVINRKTEAIKNVSTWSAEVNKHIRKGSAPAGIEIKTVARTNPDATITLDISSTLTANGADLSNLKYQVIMTESSIVSWQAFGDGSYDLEYMHNHVYRKSANGVDGDGVRISASEPYLHTCTLTYMPYSNESKAAIVGILYNANGVIQVTEQHVNI